MIFHENEKFKFFFKFFKALFGKFQDFAWIEENNMKPYEAFKVS